jgi:hypothetical protein
LTAGTKRLDIFSVTSPNATEARILVVAGPSGSGKTTFIEALKRGTLPAPIRNLLPAGCESWPTAGVTRAASADPDQFQRWVTAASDTGLVLHYDNAFIYRSGVAAYENDGAMALFRLGDRPTIVSLKPSIAQLVAQHRGRKEALHRAKPFLHRAWRSAVRNPVRTALRRLTGGVDSTDLYRYPDWLPLCYSRWDAAVAELIRDKPLARALDVEPCEGTAPDGSFLLIDRADT